ncbi:MAG: hypothetical protein H3C43_10750, partial [Leptonema sp. (in: Bacteria)]|nr:hypothetical protein [Leptonema sp. (in: bacteria)]
MSIHDILNAGLGLYNEGEKRLKDALQSLQNGYSELKSKGEQDQSKEAEKLRQSLDQTIRGIRQISTGAEERLQSLVKEAAKNYDVLLSGIESQLNSMTQQGKKGIGTVREKMQDFSKTLKTQGPDRFRKAVETLLSQTNNTIDPFDTGDERMVSILMS